MAKAKSDTTAKTTTKVEKTTVRRIKADESSAKKTTTKKAATPIKPVTKKPTAPKTKRAQVKLKRDINQETKNPLVALSNYFRGAWIELNQVRWPNRSATWSMTLAVLLFTALFVALIILLDIGFNWLFKQLLV